MKQKYRFLDHPADAYIEAYGDSLEELLENSALAMFDVMVDVSKVEPKIEKQVESRGFDLENLLYNWLEDWLFYYSTELLVFSKFKVHEIKRDKEEFVVRASGWGEKFDEKKHEPKVEVKAATYSQMLIGKVDGKWVARFVLDI